MDLDWLRDFLALADQKTFSRAAEGRNVTQPAFSRRIRALEDWIGTPLFVRGPQGATLTPAGIRFHPAATALSRDLDTARRAARAAGARETAVLSIAATHALSFTFFPNWIREVLAPRALGTLNLISDSMGACEAIMQAGEVQFLLCHSHPEAPPRLDPDRFPSVRVGDDVLVPLCAPDADGRATWSLPARAAAVPVLAYGQASGLGRIVAACRGEELGETTLGITSHLAATLASMAREGHGVAWLPQTLASDDMRRGILVRAGPERFDIPVEIRLLRSPENRNRAADGLWNSLAA